MTGSERMREWYKNHRDYARAMNSLRYREKRKHYRRLGRLWKQRNRSLNAAHSRKHRCLKNGAKGSHTLQQWLAICRKYDNRCLDCWKKKKLTEDHVIPLCKGGSDFVSNIQPLCKRCNCNKFNKTTDFRKRRKQKMSKRKTVKRRGTLYMLTPAGIKQLGKVTGQGRLILKTLKRMRKATAKTLRTRLGKTLKTKNVAASVIAVYLGRFKSKGLLAAKLPARG